jgi:hypothetical protein
MKVMLQFLGVASQFSRTDCTNAVVKKLVVMCHDHPKNITFEDCADKSAFNAIMTGAAVQCPHHPEIFIRIGDAEKERQAYVLADRSISNSSQSRARPSSSSLFSQQQPVMPEPDHPTKIDVRGLNNLAEVHLLGKPRFAALAAERKE